MKEIVLLGAVGCFSFDDRLSDVVDFVQKTAEVGSGFVYPVGLKGLMDASRDTFYQKNAGGLGKDSLRFYAAGALTMTYFWHADQKDGDAKPGGRIKAWLKALADGSDEKEARGALLLDDRTYEEVEKEIVKAYRRDLDIEFP